jgi:hypothetical protein
MTESARSISERYWFTPTSPAADRPLLTRPLAQPARRPAQLSAGVLADVLTARPACARIRVRARPPSSPLTRGPGPRSEGPSVRQNKIPALLSARQLDEWNRAGATRRVPVGRPREGPR